MVTFEKRHYLALFLILMFISILQCFFTRYHENSNNMNKIYSTAKVPSFENPKKLLSLEPDLAEIFEHSRDNKELEYYWNEWRKATGAKMREDFTANIALTNEAARLEQQQSI